MTNPTPHGQVPEALRLADALERPGYGWHTTPAQCAAVLRRLHTENEALRTQQPAPAGATPSAYVNGAGIKADDRPFTVIRKLDARFHDLVTFPRAETFAASHTPPAEQQAAPKTAPGVGNSGFDHQTAADFLSGKTVSDEAVRKFVQASRWAHDERAALSATLLAMHGVLTSREAEIALLKKALLEAEAAPQPAPAPLSDDAKDAARYRWLREGNDAKHGAAWHVAVNLYGCEWDAAIDAAIAAQGGK